MATAPVALTEAEAPAARPPAVTRPVFVTAAEFVLDWLMPLMPGSATSAEEELTPDIETELTAPEALTEAEAPRPSAPASIWPLLVTVAELVADCEMPS